MKMTAYLLCLLACLIAEGETPIASPAPPAPALTLDRACDELVAAASAYATAVDLLPLPGPQARSVNKDSMVFRNLNSAIVQLQDVQKKTMQRLADLEKKVKAAADAKPAVPDAKPPAPAKAPEPPAAKK